MQSTIIEDLVSNLPAHLTASIDSLLQRPVATREHMLAELDAYARRIDDSVRRQPDLDVNLAEGTGCHLLLGDGIVQRRRR